jgi:hypothetical protein
MIGDSAESDPVIYLGSKLYAEGRLSRLNYVQYLQIFGVPRLDALQLLRHSRLTRMNVDSILIRKLPESKFPELAPLTDPLIYFRNFYEVALYFFQSKVVEIEELSKLTHAFHNYYGISSVGMSQYLKLMEESSDDALMKEESRRVGLEITSQDFFAQKKKAVTLLKRKPLDAFSTLTEMEILQLAKEWKKKKR